MKGLAKEERGAALATTLLFMTLTFILLSAMMATTGNDIAIAGLHRDGVRAMELAQAGLQEAVRRIAAGRPFAQGFTSSLNPGVTVTVTRDLVGTDSAYLEIKATATVGQVTRRLSFLVLQQMNLFPPNIIWGPSNASEGEDIRAGDVYSQTWVQYGSKPLASPSTTFTNAGWRISYTGTVSGPGPGPLGPCYTHAACVALGDPMTANWYPAMRRAEFATTGTGADILAQTNKCPAGGGGPLPPDQVSGTLADETVVSNIPAYGFDVDNSGSSGNLAVTAALPCGLPYKWVSRPFTDETGGSQTRLFKTIVFEQWFTNYWTFDQAQMAYVKTSGLATYPQFAAIPPNPTTTTDPSNFDRVLTGGGTVTGDLGCKYPEMSCSPAVDRPISVLLNGGSWTLTGPTLGHGTIVVNGNLTINGDIQYWGTVLVTGTFDAGTKGTGPRDIFGGLITTTTSTSIHRSLHVTSGGTMATVPVGQSVVIGMAWWER